MKTISPSTIRAVNELEGLLDNLLKEAVTHGLGRSMRQIKKEIQAFKSHNGAKKVNFDYKGKSLQIGGGKHVLENFVNVDIFPPADIIYDVREGLPFEENTIQFIFSEHFLEHIDYPVSVKKFINESFRILKLGGQIVVGVPDSEKVINAYVKKDMQFYKKMMRRWYLNRNCQNHFNTFIDLVNYHFRDQDDDEKYNPHFWGYDFEKLHQLFIDGGFTKVEKWKFDKSIANPKREFGSIYIIATK